MSRQTHNVAVVEGVASYVVSLGPDGKIAHQGKWSRVLQEDAALSQELDVERKELETDIEDASDPVKAERKQAAPKSGQGKLVPPEEIAQGHISKRTGESQLPSQFRVVDLASPDINIVGAYLSDIGGRHPFVFWGSITFGLMICQTINVVQPYWLGYWAQQYEDHDRSSVSVSL